MRRVFGCVAIAAALLSTASLSAAKPQAKYVFYFIGDGMGLNQVLGTQIYLSNTATQKSLEYSDLSFTGFPVASFATNKSAATYVTDSSAAGTALAAGYKTVNSMLGVKEDGETPVNSIAYFAKKAGYRVGVATTVGINHATPASFYGHNRSRNEYYNLGLELVESGYEFFAGGGFLGESTDPSTKPYLKDLARKAGYSIAWGYGQYKEKAPKADRIILFQADSTATNVPFAIDRKPNDLTLAQMTESGIDFLSKDLRKGFFFMVEGGQIDSACHDNDVTSAYEEVKDFSDAIAVAVEFYNAHPKETLIVVTADHETGGLALGTAGQYALNYDVLHNQKASRGSISRKIGELRVANGNNVSWEQVKGVLKEYLGLWDKVPVSMKQEISLMQTYDTSFAQVQAVPGRPAPAVRVSSNEPIVVAALNVLYQQALVSFSSGSHTGAYVPLFVIGAGQQEFATGLMDNTDIPKKIAKVAGYPATW